MQSQEKISATVEHVIYKPPASLTLVLFPAVYFRFWVVLMSISVKLRPLHHLQLTRSCQCISVLTEEATNTGMFER